MAQKQGSIGYMAAAIEAVAYGTLGATLVYQQGISSNMNLVRERITVPVLGSVRASTGLVVGSYVQGDFTVALSAEVDDLDVLYGAGATSGGSAYAFGYTGTTPTDHESFSLFVDLGGVEYDYAGLVPTQYVWNLSSTEHSTLTVSCIGKSVVKYAGAARNPSLPPVTEVLIPGTVGTLTVNTGTAIGSCKSATITVARQATGWDRRRLGSTTIAQPLDFDSPTITAEFVCELSDDAGNDTEALVDEYIAGTDLGTVALGSQFSLTECHILGAMPNAGRGLRDFSLSVQATSLSVVTA